MALRKWAGETHDDYVSEQTIGIMRWYLDIAASIDVRHASMKPYRIVFRVQFCNVPHHATAPSTIRLNHTLRSHRSNCVSRANHQIVEGIFNSFSYNIVSGSAAGLPDGINLGRRNLF